MFYVYILSLDEKGGKQFYIGYTSDLRKRISRHKDGDTKTTKRRNPRLIYYEAYTEKNLALKRVRGLKNSGSVYMGLFKRLGLK